MLLKIREKSTGWVAGVIVALLVLTFALFGINSYFGSGSEPVVATINDTEIKSTQFRRAVYNIRQQVQNMTGQSVSAEDPIFKQEALDRLINSEVMNQATYNYGMRVSDERIYQMINSLDTFRSEDRFDPMLYQRTLSQLGMSEALFEQQMRQDMLAEQFQGAIAESVITIESEIDQLARLKNQTRDFEYTVISVKSLMDQIDIDQESVKQYYAQNKNSFVEPEQVKIAYLELTVDKVAERIQLEEQAVQDYFENNRLNYQVPERRKIWQAKIRIPENYDGDAEADARAKAEELAGIFRNGDDFVAIAEQHTTGPNAAIQVSITESGEMKQGTLKQELDEVLAALETGATSEPVKSDQSFHVIKLLEVLAAEKKELADVREQVENNMRREQAQREYFDLAEQIAALTYENPDTLQYAADATDLAVMESDFFNRETDDGLVSEPEVIQAVFSDEVLLNGINSDPIELDPERMIVVRVIDRKAEGVKSLDEVSDEVIQRLKREQAMQMVKSIAETVMQSLAQGDTLEQAAAAAEQTVESVTEVERDAVSVNRSVLRTAFRLPAPKDGKRSFTKDQFGNGDIAIVELSAVNYQDELKGRLVDAAAAEVKRLRAQMEWDSLFQQLKSDSKINIFEDNL